MHVISAQAATSVQATVPKPETITVILCAYTEVRWNDPKAAVESVQRQSHPADEIVVVIDHNDEMLYRVQEQISGVVAIANRHSRGLSGARNSAIEVACGEIIAFLDDDAIAANQCPGAVNLRTEEIEVIRNLRWLGVPTVFRRRAGRRSRRRRS